MDSKLEIAKEILSVLALEDVQESNLPQAYHQLDKLLLGEVFLLLLEVTVSMLLHAGDHLLSIDSFKYLLKLNITFSPIKN
jgi:hypothetical protein